VKPIAAAVTAFNRRPEAFLIAVLVLQVVLWTLVPALTYRSVPIDVMENIGWGREWQLGYPSHPPLQAWLTEIAFELSGRHVWSIYLLSQLAIVLTAIPIYLLGREAGDARQGLLAVLLFTLVFYANLPTPEFNANVVQMPVWSWATLVCWRAFKERRLGWWVALGALAGLTVYAKYSAVIVLAALLLASLAIPRLRSAYRTPGPYLAMAVAALVVIPHLLWMWQSDFITLRYAEGRAGHRSGIARILPTEFIFAQILDNFLPALVLLLSGVIAVRRPSPPSRSASDIDRFIIWMALAPYGLTILFSVVSGYGLLDMWGAPMPIWISLAAVRWLWPRWREDRLPVLLATWALFFVGIPVGLGVYAVEIGRSASPARIAWPNPTLAADLLSAWKGATGGAPLRIVIGDKWSAGPLVAYTQDHPAILTNGEYRLSPWVNPADVARDGALVVWLQSDSVTLPSAYAQFGPFAATGIITEPFSSAPGSRSAAVGWAVRKPG